MPSENLSRSPELETADPGGESVRLPDRLVVMTHGVGIDVDVGICICIRHPRTLRADRTPSKVRSSGG
jgi:hypothetical protein